MATPHDENETLGLPPGARNQLLREIERARREAAPKSEQESGGASHPTPPRAPAPRPAAPPSPRAQPPRAEPPTESFETIPPVVGFPKRREPPSRHELDPGARRPAPPPQPRDFKPPASTPPQGLDPNWTVGLPAAPGLPEAPEDETAADSSPPQDPWEAGPLNPQPIRPSTAPNPPPPPARPAAPPQAARPPAPAAQRPPAAGATFLPGRSPMGGGINQTIAGGLADIAGLGGAAPLTLQFFNVGHRRWSDLGAIRESEIIVGRATFQGWSANVEGLAEAHLRLIIDEGRLFVEPLRSLNGVYIKLAPHRPVELRAGSRFRMGRHVLEFRPGEGSEPIEALCSEDGEVFQSHAIAPQGFIDLIGPDNARRLSYPLTKPGEPGARIGRDGSQCDLTLAEDNWVSSVHARVYFSKGQCWLEDLKSTNGTFIQITESQEIQSGVNQRHDSGDHVAIGGYMIRVVKERP